MDRPCVGKPGNSESPLVLKSFKLNFEGELLVRALERSQCCPKARPVGQNKIIFAVLGE